MLLEEHEYFRGEIMERTGGKRPSMLVKGLYQLGGVRNRNNRVYPDRIWEKHTAPDHELMQRVARRRVVGEMAHPKDGKGYYPNASHLITKLWTERSKVPGCEICEKQSQPGHLHVMGMEEVLGTPHGRILQELYDRDIEVGISSRGSGSLRSTGRNESEVQDDYKCNTWDHVEDPSTPGCWPKAVNEALTGIVATLMDPVCDIITLQQYRDVMESVAGSLVEDVDQQSQALQLIEAIDRKLASPACVAAASTVGAPAGGWPDFKNQVTESSTEATQDDKEENEMEKFSLDSPEVQGLIERKLREMKGEYDEELARVLGHVDHLQKENTTLQTKIAAHESTGRELATQLREASIKVKAYEDWANGSVNEGQAGAVAALSELQGKHDLALQVIDELVGRVRKYKVYEKKAAMAVKVLGETIAREQRRDVVDHVERILAHESQEFSASVKADLLECESIPEVNKRYGVIKRGVGAATAGRITEEKAPAAAAAAPARTVLVEGKLPPKAGQINESSSEGKAITESDLPPSRVESDGGQVNEQVRLARLLTKKANPHRAAVAING